MERIEKRASARLRYSRRMPSPPRNSPAPPESAISPKRVRPGRKFALDDFDRRDLGVALIDRDAGRPVLARARAGAAGNDLVLHITLAAIGVAAAENDGAAAAAVGTHLARHHVAHGVEDGVHQR